MRSLIRCRLQSRWVRQSSVRVPAGQRSNNILIGYASAASAAHHHVSTTRLLCQAPLPLGSTTGGRWMSSVFAMPGNHHLRNGINNNIMISHYAPDLPVKISERVSGERWLSSGSDSFRNKTEHNQKVFLDLKSCDTIEAAANMAFDHLII
mmetsp:Transcript_11371/g.24975  ORF Transcript_11371/g.24975 Transcript_11371/m.24975 type:complete len:151 (-) Transcript_11371:39-491(-)